jgi:hypothetical protein
MSDVDCLRTCHEIHGKNKHVLSAILHSIIPCFKVEMSRSHRGEYEDDSLLGYGPCDIVEVDRRFGDTYCLHHQGDKSSPDNGAIRTSETLICFYETTWRHIPEGCHPLPVFFNLPAATF